MTTPPIDITLRDKVTAIIREAAETEILPRFQNLSDDDIFEKSRPGDLVTAADIAAEAYLSLKLQALLPNSAVVGEEGAEENPAVMDVLATEQLAWVIDPVDGTRNFAHGKPCFAVIVALCQGGKTLAGWIYDPMATETQFASSGQGAWQNTSSQADWQPISRAKPLPIEKMIGSLSRYARDKLDPDQKMPKKTVRYGCVGREYMGLARGDLHFALYGGKLKPWDHAAGVLIHQEAGGASGLFPDQTPYTPTGLPEGNRLLLSPHPTSWKKLHDMIIGC